MMQCCGSIQSCCIWQAIEEISEHASREWSIEKALDKMHADWAELMFELAEWKATGSKLDCVSQHTCLCLL